MMRLREWRVWNPMPLAALLVLALAPKPLDVEQREYSITASFGDNGKMTMTRKVDPQSKVIELVTVTRWSDGAVATENYRFDAAGTPIEITREETRKGSTKRAWLKLEGEKVRTHWDFSETYEERYRPNPISDFKDSSVWWFVTETPAAEAKTNWLDYRPPFFCEPSITTYLGEKEITVAGKSVTTKLVRRTIGNRSPQIDSYLDEKGMPVRREWSSGASGIPYRIDELIPSKRS